ncbi:GyrI-like domain-containing protein [Pseudarthrobacter sp. NPDC092419]|uniref:GyrI-like domain-containing protein n=1 Tax=Pseudarthrobacter sp. NPDC092419 TaxID=3364414 RepID=UPI00381CCAC3
MSETGSEPRRIQTTEQLVAVIRERVPMTSLTEFFGRAFGAVMAAMQEQGAFAAGPPFARYHGMPGDSVDVEAGFPFGGHFNGADAVQTGTLPGGDAYEAIHTGPYETLGETYGAIQQRMQAEGLTPADTMWEYYLSGPEQEPDPAKWQTKVVWPAA